MCVYEFIEEIIRVWAFFSLPEPVYIKKKLNEQEWNADGKTRGISVCVFFWNGVENESVINCNKWTAVSERNSLISEQSDINTIRLRLSQTL